ncbi:CG6041 [Drosophila busckii]|uniref:CG6041 n=1 Tax=Drosophila busckii TaxID=30019 RepID=A0A0M4EEP4_DROBS|nr:anionic trypsin [Drosophila busckii]ALC46504.1 CG6041 [Drosophila busckii]
MLGGASTWQLLTAVHLFLTAVASAQNSTPSTHAKVVGGYDIEIEQAPYQLSVRLRLADENNVILASGHLCGGTLISQRLAVSAAHCFAVNDTSAPLTYKEGKRFVVVAGITSLFSDEESAAVYRVERIIGHEDYSLKTFENDIALIYLNQYVPWGLAKVRAVPIAAHPYRPGTLCLISGWGRRRERLQQAKVPLVPQRLCNYIYFKMPPSQICAGFLAGGVDACQGDSGGPLICNGELAGVISWGIDCAQRMLPGVYANVSHFYDWIREMNGTLNYAEFRDVALEKKSASVSAANVSQLLVLIGCLLCKIIN